MIRSGMGQSRSKLGVAARGVALGFATLLLAACGGMTDNYKDQISVSISPSGDIELEAGQEIPLRAEATAIKELVQAMTWSIEPVSTPVLGETPTLRNAACADSTFTLRALNGVGECDAILVVPEGAETMNWRITMNAVAATKGSASRSFLLKVEKSKPGTGKIRVEAPPLVTTDAQGQALRTNHFIALNANAVEVLTSRPLRDPRYTWTLTGAPAGVNIAEILLAGADRDTVQFIPRVAGIYQFKVQAEVTLEGQDEMASTQTLVEVVDSDASLNLAVYAGDAQNVTSGTPISLLGSVLQINGVAVANPQLQWLAPPGVLLANPNSLTPTFFAPTVTAPTQLVFVLTATAVINGRIHGPSSSMTVVLVSPPAVEE